MIMKKIDDLMIELNKEFQKEIFLRAINKYGSSIKVSKIFKIPASSIRGYKNLYFDSIPESLILDLIAFGIVENKQFLIKNDLNRILDSVNIRAGSSS